MNIEEILAYIVDDDYLHARFLNTLSLQENIGARKISASEEPQTTTYMVLKHAAEEHRHAFYLKKQMERLLPGTCPTYEPEYLLSPRGSRFYLNRLDLETCRYLKKNMNLYGAGLKFAAYLLVTYAIEVRADIIYPLYQQALDSVNSRISVRSIIAEEQGHLEEMIAQLQLFSPDWEKHAEHVTAMENRIYGMWIDDLAKDLLK
jgi:hypothetical protein